MNPPPITALLDIFEFHLPGSATRDTLSTRQSFRTLLEPSKPGHAPSGRFSPPLSKKATIAAPSKILKSIFQDPQLDTLSILYSNPRTLEPSNPPFLGNPPNLTTTFPVHPKRHYYQRPPPPPALYPPASPLFHFHFHFTASPHRTHALTSTTSTTSTTAQNPQSEKLTQQNKIKKSKIQTIKNQTIKKSNNQTIKKHINIDDIIHTKGKRAMTIARLIMPFRGVEGLVSVCFVVRIAFIDEFLFS